MQWTDPFIALTVAATVTKTIKLGTGICLLPERDPLITAKVVASLDVYARGRVILGVGAGWLREETELMGTSFRLRWKRLRESVEAMRDARAKGLQVIDEKPRPGARGSKIAFLHPKSTGGILIHFVERVNE